MEIENYVTHHEAKLSEVTLHYVEAKPEASTNKGLILLLHGFPEFWYSWRHQLIALSAAGYRVVAPDLRGYNTSSKPRKVSAYTVHKLSLDVSELITFLGEEQAIVIGHDWGAMISWTFAMQYPDQLKQLAILNVPHPERFQAGLRTFKQLRKSWYIFFFQLPWLPECFFKFNNYSLIRNAWKKDTKETGAFTDEDLQQYFKAFAQPRAITAMLNYYRAVFREIFTAKKSTMPVIEHPTLVIWGEQDRYLGVELSEPLPEWVPNLTMKRIPAASHWVQVDHPQEVNRLLLAFIEEE